MQDRVRVQGNNNTEPVCLPSQSYGDPSAKWLSIFDCCIQNTHTHTHTHTHTPSQLLHRCFSSWYTAVVEQRAQLGKAAAVCDWKLLLRIWRAWRTFVGQRKARKEREAIARELQREKRWVWQLVVEGRVGTYLTVVLGTYVSGCVHQVT